MKSRIKYYIITRAEPKIRISSLGKILGVSVIGNQIVVNVIEPTLSVFSKDAEFQIISAGEEFGLTDNMTYVGCINRTGAITEYVFIKES